MTDLDVFLDSVDLEVFTDVVETEVEVIEDSAGKPLKLRVLLTKANVVNKNRRLYPREVLSDMVDRMKTRIEAGEDLTMEWEHPKTRRDAAGKPIGFHRNLERQISAITDTHMRGEKVYVDTVFLDTAMGRSMVTKYRSGQRLHVSLRSLGNAKLGKVRGERVAIATYLDGHGGDWVDNPAMVDAGPEEVLTDAEIDQALDSAKEADQMDPQLQAALQAITDSLNALSARIGNTTGNPVTAQDIQALRDQVATLGKGACTEPGCQKKSGHDGDHGEMNTAATDALRAVVDGLASQIAGLAQRFSAADAEAAKAAEKAKVTTFVDGLATKNDMSRFSAPAVDQIKSFVACAENEEEAARRFTDSVRMHDAAIAAAKASAIGYGNPAGGQGTTQDPVIQVGDGPKPYQTVLDRIDMEFQDYARAAVTHHFDPSLRRANKAFTDQMVKEFEAKHYKDLCQSAEHIMTDGVQLGVMTDATNTSSLWNQPVLMLALMMQQFWMMEALQFCQGMGPSSFTLPAGANAPIGSLLRVPVEYPVMPTGHVALPNFMSGMRVAEAGGIPEIDVKTAWLNFWPDWLRAAFRLTAEAEQELKNGPLNYNAWTRLTFHLSQYKARTVDWLVYEEMLLAADEYKATKVTNEAVGAGEWTHVGGGSAGGYGANVVGVAQLLCGGTAGAAKTKVPLVRPRTLKDLSASGQRTTSTRNPVTVANVGATVQVLGYLGPDGQVYDIPGGGTATFAIDWHKGKAVFVVGSGVGATTRPTFSAYSFATNYDTFQLTSPTLAGGETENDYYDKLLRQVDFTHAKMGSYDRLTAPDLAIMSLVSSVYIQTAATFQKWNSPPGSTLTNPRIVSNAKFGERSGVELCRIQAPWSAGDSRIWLGRQGATKYAIDTPFEIQGPFPSYTSDNPPKIKDEKIGYGRENSVIATPQAEDQSGNILNPHSRTIILL